jgi:hypothetical protein
MITALGPEWRHRTLLREVNERIFALTQEFAPNPGGDLPVMVFCECGIEGCMTPIEMTSRSTRPRAKRPVVGLSRANTSRPRTRCSITETVTP